MQRAQIKLTSCNGQNDIQVSDSMRFVSSSHQCMEASELSPPDLVQQAHKSLAPFVAGAAADGMEVEWEQPQAAPCLTKAVILGQVGLPQLAFGAMCI